MNTATRLLVLIAAAASLQGCVVFTYGEGGLNRVPTADVPSHLASVLGVDREEAKSPAPRAARHTK